MSETKTEVRLAAAPLGKEIIPELIHAKGPCITLLLPPYRPGSKCNSCSSIFLRNQLNTPVHQRALTQLMRVMTQKL